jgi:hypothetical protein
MFPERNCATCTALSKAEWGCNATLTLEVEEGEVVEVWEDGADVPLMLGDQEWYRCPRRPILDDPKFFVEAIRYRNIRESGFLPFPGAYCHQPNLLTEVWAEMDYALGEVDKMKAHRDKMRRGEFE